MQDDSPRPHIFALIRQCRTMYEKGENGPIFCYLGTVIKGNAYIFLFLKQKAIVLLKKKTLEQYFCKKQKVNNIFALIFKKVVFGVVSS